MRRRTILGTVGGIAALSKIPQAQAQSAESISFGETVSGTISEDDPTDPKYPGYHTQPYEFEADEGDDVRITLDMPSADEWIRVESPSNNDTFDEGEDTAEFETSSSGEYTIYPQSFPEEEPGEFSLELELVGETESDDSEQEEEEPEPPDIAPESVYTVETDAIAASDETAVFEIQIEPDSNALVDYEPGSVSGLELSLALPELEFSRIIPLPNDEGELANDAGSLILAGTAFATGGTAGAVLGAISLATEVGDFLEEASDEFSSSGARSIRFSGSNPVFGEPSLEFFDQKARFLIEVESDEPIDDIDSPITTWSSKIGFGYIGEPEQIDGTTETGEKYYNADVEGDLASVDDPDEFTC